MTKPKYKLRPEAARETGLAEFGSFFHIVDAAEGDRCAYPARLDTYGCGCAHDCSYCYAKSLLDFRGLWNPRAPLAADMGKIRALIPSLRGTVRLGGMTDCFQPAERRVRNTYNTINLLNAAGVPYLIVTKSALVAAPEYLRLYDPQLAHVQVSVTATSDAGGREYEKASPIGARIAAAEALDAAGIDVALRLSPYIPRLVEPVVLGASSVKKVCVEFLRVNAWVKKWAKREDTEACTLKAGGYRHLPLEQKVELLGQIVAQGKTATVCEDVPEHYVYWQEHVNPNPRDCCNLRAPA